MKSHLRERFSFCRGLAGKERRSYGESSKAGRDKKFQHPTSNIQGITKLQTPNSKLRQKVHPHPSEALLRRESWKQQAGKRRLQSNFRAARGVFRRNRQSRG